ncbi:hypothetical protein ACI76O_11480 [Capnocytophaga cynodegmi]|uniref:hypothetical protein n=1 Tax=Capnocytophaga cynodegmi TaxID=28189 RepID=UPI001AC0CDB2|nr:hypothetical protein [Capnocytophaga cynodegmi]GIM53337.1 hypothetical protein CAPN004_23660 [Capnocytophaga cynodegmi]
MKKISAVIMLFSSISAFPQKIDGICNPIDKIGYAIRDISVTFYKKNTYVKERYKKFSEVTNLSPEELLKSHISTQNNDWLSYNFNEKKNWEHNKIENLLDKNNYIELLFKFNFKVLNREYSIVKLNAKNDILNSNIPITFLMQKHNNKWFFTSEHLLQKVKLALYLLPIEDIYIIFNNKRSGNNQPLNTLLGKIWENGIFNFYAFINGFGEYLLKNESKSNAHLSLKESITTKIKNKGIIPLSIQEFCSYFENENSEISSRLLDKIRDIQTFEKGKISLQNSIKIDVEGMTIFYIKYDIMAENNVFYSGVKVFDENFNEIEKKDNITVLLKINNKEQMERLFFNSTEYVIYE